MSHCGQNRIGILEEKEEKKLGQENTKKSTFRSYFEGNMGESNDS